MKVKEFKSFDEYENYVESNSFNELVPTIVIDENYCAIDFTTYCKSWKTAIRRAMKVFIKYEDVYNWLEGIKESCENNCFSDCSVYAGKYTGDYTFGVEEVSDGVFYIYLKYRTTEVSNEETKGEETEESTASEETKTSRKDLKKRGNMKIKNLEAFTLSKLYSYRDVEKVCGDCSHFNACMQGYQTIAPSCCMFDSLHKARKNPEWHHVSLYTFANLDFDMLDTKRQKYMMIYKLARNTIKSMYKCKSITQYRSLTNRLITYVHSAYRHDRCTIALVQYVRAKIADVNVNCNVQSSIETEEFGYHESRRYN